MRRVDRKTWDGGGFDPRGGRIHRHAPDGGAGGRRRRRGRPGANRARRGDVRTAALALLAERPMHGYEIIQEIEARSAGVWKPSPGSVYPTLQLLEDTGLVTAAEIDGRRVFSLTETGRTEAEQRQDTAPPWAELAEDAGRPDQRLRKSISPVATAVHELFHHGTQAQQEQARVILNDTRKRLYMLLAEGDEEDAGTHLG